MLFTCYNPEQPWHPCTSLWQPSPCLHLLISPTQPLFLLVTEEMHSLLILKILAFLNLWPSVMGWACASVALNFGPQTVTCCSFLQYLLVSDFQSKQRVKGQWYIDRGKKPFKDVSLFGHCHHLLAGVANPDPRRLLLIVFQLPLPYRLLNTWFRCVHHIRSCKCRDN